MFFPKEFRPSRKKNKMKNFGDIAFMRDYYYTRNLKNLKFAFYKRLNWMNEFINKDDCVVELGSGIGVSRDFITRGYLILTDTVLNPWIDIQVNALCMPFKDLSVDVLILNNVFHHLSRPKLFFLEALRVLKSGGHILIQDHNLSFLSRLTLHVLGLEGYSFVSQIYNSAEICSDENDNWSANCALTHLFFDNKKSFYKNIPGFLIKKDSPSGFFTFILSGGVSGKTITIPLSWKILVLFDKIDTLLIRLLPSVFSFQRQIVLRKNFN